MAVFAAVWWILGTAFSHRGTLPKYTAAILISAVIIVIGLRLGVVESITPKGRARRARLVGIASGVEGLAILVAVNILANIGRQDLTTPVIAILVGLHFLPLAHWLPARLYYGTCIALVVVGFAGMTVQDADMRIYAVSVGAALILWLTSGIVIWRGYRNRAALRP